MPSGELKARPIVDPILRSALRQLDTRFREKLGRKYLRLILFGSRARGDHAPDSDADVAVVLHGEIDNRWQLKRQMIEETYPILLEAGLYIQPWPIAEWEFDDPDRSPNPDFVRNILRDGIRA